MNEQQQAELVRMKQYFPFRIVFGALNPETGEFSVHARKTARPMNEFLRKGWLVWKAGV